MGNHHALRVMAPTIGDHFGVNLTGKRLRFFRDVAREKWPLQPKCVGAIHESPLHRPCKVDLSFLPTCWY